MTEPSSPAGTPGSLLRLLIVDDEPHIAERCLEELNKAGIEMASDVISSFEGLPERLENSSFQLVVSDLNLPGEDSRKVFTHLHERHGDIPVIWIARGDEEAERVEEFMKNGTVDCVAQSEISRLPAVVQRALGQQEQARRLRHAEEGWESLAEIVTDALLVICEGNVAYANPAAFHLIGASEPGGLVGKPALSVFHPVDRDTLDAEIKRCRPGSQPVVFAAHWQCLDGRLLEVRITAGGVHWRGGEAVQLLARDVSESKRVEATISSLAAFAQFNPNPVFEFSPEGRIIFFNEAAAEMARSLGKESPHDLVPSDTPVFVRTCLESGQRKSPVETTLGGRTFAWSFFPVTPNHVVHCYVAEVTDRHKLEAQLRHSQKLESVGRLASGVAHDFNNILTVIQGHIGLLKSSPGLNAATNESLQQVSRAAERAGLLTGQLLAFSRKSAMNPRRLDLNEVLTNISRMLHRTLGEDIDYQFSYAPSLPGVYADLGMVEQVVMILAVNARDAMPRGGQLIISTSLAEVDQAHADRFPEARPGTFVCLSMVDSGCGMDHVTMSRLFEPFFTTKEFGKGTGLGLAVVGSIVQQHQGWIEVQSMMGQGSTFKIFLPPCTPEQEERLAAPTGEAIPRGGETVLVVEDEPPVRWIVKNVLERYGYTVLEAGGGVEALAIWHQHHHDIALLLTDMVMPVGLNGQELAEKFRGQKHELKVIYTSGYSAQVAGKRLSLTEGLDFLQKPFDADKLAWAVRKRLDE